MLKWKYFEYRSHGQIHNGSITPGKKYPSYWLLAKRNSDLMSVSVRVCECIEIHMYEYWIHRYRNTQEWVLQNDTFSLENQPLSRENTTKYLSLGVWSTTIWGTLMAGESKGGWRNERNEQILLSWLCHNSTARQQTSILFLTKHPNKAWLWTHRCVLHGQKQVFLFEFYKEKCIRDLLTCQVLLSNWVSCSIMRVDLLPITFHRLS